MSAMDTLTVDELRRLNTLGFVAICSNGHVIAVVEEDKAEEKEKERTEHGY
jgi:hypothetical protein